MRAHGVRQWEFSCKDAQEAKKIRRNRGVKPLLKFGFLRIEIVGAALRRDGRSGTRSATEPTADFADGADDSEHGIELGDKASSWDTEAERGRTGGHRVRQPELSRKDAQPVRKHQAESRYKTAPTVRIAEDRNCRSGFTPRWSIRIATGNRTHRKIRR